MGHYSWMDRKKKKANELDEMGELPLVSKLSERSDDSLHFARSLAGLMNSRFPFSFLLSSIAHPSCFIGCAS